MIILGHHYVTILLAKMLIWAPFSQRVLFLSVLTPDCAYKVRKHHYCRSRYLAY